MAKAKFKNRIGETVMVKWKELQPLQPSNAKLSLNLADIEKSILRHGFAQPFYGWLNDGIIYTIDGHTRKQVLSKMDGVPDELPCTLIHAKNRKDAIEILLEVFNQKHNPFNMEVLNKFIETEKVEIDLESIHAKSSSMLANKNFHTEEEVETETVETELYPITILQTREEYDLFEAIKNKIGVKSSMKAFSQIIQTYHDKLI